MFLLPGCKFGGNPASPDSTTPGVSPDPFMPNQPGTPLDDSRTGGQSPEFDNKSSVPYLEMIGPEEIINYEYANKRTVLQTPEFRVKLHNFSGNADSSMFICFIDGEKVLPSYAPAEKVVSFTPDKLLADGSHETMVAFTGANHLASAGLSFEVCTTPPSITDVMHQPDKGNFIVCFDRQIESKYALNPDNWEINSVSGIFASAKMDPHSGGTRVILKIASKEDLPEIGPGGYKIGFYSIQGFTEGLISPVPLWGWGNHGGESDGVGLRTGQSGDCEDCEAIKIGAEHWKHVSKQTEHHRLAYELEENPDLCPIMVVASYQYSVIANEPFYDERDPQGSFWKDEDTWTYGDSGIWTETYIINPTPRCRSHMYGGSETISGLVYDFYALCGVNPEWVLIDSISYGNFQGDIGNPYFYETPQIMTGAETATWLEDSKDAFDPEQVHASEFWDNILFELTTYKCDFYVTGATYDMHANNGNFAWNVDVLQPDGSFIMSLIPMIWPPLLVIDEYDLYHDEKYPWVGEDCSGSERDEDGFWKYEIWYGYMPMVYYAPPDPPLGVRLRATDCWENWKRSDNLMDEFTGSWDVKKLSFYEDVAGTLKELTFCDSPLVDRSNTGSCQLNLAAWVEIDDIAYSPEYIETYVSNDTDEYFPPDCGSVVYLPLYKLTSAVDPDLYIAMESLFSVPNPSSCRNVFYTRGPSLSCNSLICSDSSITQNPNDPFDLVTQPLLWVSHREFGAWFTDFQKKDSTNAYSCDHSGDDYHTPPITYGSPKGIYHDGCSSADKFRFNYIPDIAFAGFAFIYAWVSPSGQSTDVGIHSESDLIFVNSHYSDGFYDKDTYGNPNQRGFQPFCYWGVSYPGPCTYSFQWSDLLGSFGDDCEWFSTTGCESLLELPTNRYPNYTGPWPPLGYTAPLDEAKPLVQTNLNSIAGFDAFCKPDHVYDIVCDYNNNLHYCDGSYNNYLWRYPPPTTDCNILAWMEAFCLARNAPKPEFRNGIEAAEYARAIDANYKYDIVPGKKTFTYYWIFKETVDSYFIVYSPY